MPLTLKEHTDGKIPVLLVRASGRLTKDDYKRFVPEVERLLGKLGKVRVFFVMDDFHGWDPGALWEDIKFDIKHFSDIERLAMVGEKKWEEWMAKFCRPFTTAEIRYFDAADADQGLAWIEADFPKSENLVDREGDGAEEGAIPAPDPVDRLPPHA